MLRHLRRADGPVISCSRAFSVVAWGANSSGQCGVHSPVLLSPSEVEVQGLDALSSLVAGKSHSVAISLAGEAYTFGEGGSGQLGLGRTEHASTPQRVEALVGRALVTSAAVGRRHTLLLDASGAVYACGDNTKGSLGLGAPSVSRPPGQQHIFAAHGGLHAGAVLTPAQQRQQEQGLGFAAQAQQDAGGQAAVELSGAGGEWYTSHLLPFVDHHGRGTELQQAQHMYSDRLRGVMAMDSAWMGMQTASVAGILGVEEDNPHFTIPVKTGGSLHRDHHQQQQGEHVSSLAEQRVLSLAACGSRSVALAEGGVPWVFGGDSSPEESHNSSSSSSSSSARWPLSPQPICAAVLSALGRNGGAVQVVAGAAFCAALTVSGRVVLWAACDQGSGSPDAAQQEGPHLCARETKGFLVAEFANLPAMTSIAAGLGSLTMTDGSSVWQVSFPAATATAAGEPPSSLHPRRVLHLPDETVASIAVGGSACAAVSGSGRLHLWGSVLNTDVAALIMARSAEEGQGQRGHSPTAALRRKGAGGLWEGLGSVQPVVVPGLHGVRRIALGTHHALAEVA